MRKRLLSGVIISRSFSIFLIRRSYLRWPLPGLFVLDQELACVLLHNEGLKGFVVYISSIWKTCMAVLCPESPSDEHSDHGKAPWRIGGSASCGWGKITPSGRFS